MIKLDWETVRSSLFPDGRIELAISYVAATELKIMSALIFDSEHSSSADLCIGCQFFHERVIVLEVLVALENRFESF